MTERSSTLIDDEFIDIIPKPQAVCPGCGYRHAGAGIVCDVCKGKKPALLPATPSVMVAPAIPYVHIPAVEISPSMTTSAPALVSPIPSVIHSVSGLASSLPSPIATEAVEHAQPPSPSQPDKTTHRQSCSVCVHPARSPIDAALINNTESQRNLAKQYQVTPRQISNHRLNHLGLAPQTRQEAARRGGQVAAALTGCKVCRHPDVDIINAKIRGGMGAATIKREYRTSVIPISDKVIAKHREKCLDIAQAVPRGNRSGNPRGLQAAALRAQSAQEVHMPTPAPVSFADLVSAEIARLVSERERLATEISTLADQQAVIERQYVALRAFQEVRKGNTP